MRANSVLRELDEIHALKLRELERAQTTHMSRIQRSIKMANIRRQIEALEIASKFINSERHKLDETLASETRETTDD